MNRADNDIVSAARPSIPLPAELSDQAAAELLALLYDIARAIESHYAGQLHRYYEDAGERQPELWDEIEDFDDPPF